MKSDMVKSQEKKSSLFLSGLLEIYFFFLSAALLTKSVSESSLSEEGESDIEENEKGEAPEDVGIVDLESYTVVSSDPGKLTTSHEEIVTENVVSISYRLANWMEQYYYSCFVYVLLF